MFHKADFNFFSIEDLFLAYSGLYADEHGMKKVKEIEAKVEDSRNMHNLVFNTIHGRDIPPVDDFLAILNTVPYFIFSKAETACLGALIAMRGCIYGINPNLADERSGKWHEMTVDTIYKCHGQKVSSNSFFDNYYRQLEKLKTQMGQIAEETAKSSAQHGINHGSYIDQFTDIENRELAELILNSAGIIVNSHSMQILQEFGSHSHKAFLEVLLFFYYFIDNSTKWEKCNRELLLAYYQIFPYFCNTKDDSFSKLKIAREMGYSISMKTDFHTDKVIVSEELARELTSFLNKPLFSKNEQSGGYTTESVFAKILQTCTEIENWVSSYCK